MAVERERKYAVDPVIGTGELAVALDGNGTVPKGCGAVLLATYFDTRRHDLAGRGITLRRRQGGGDAGWHLKVPAGPDERTEYWLPLAAGGEEAVPGDLTALVARYVGRRSLLPVAVVRTARSVLDLAGPAGEPVAEVADDRVVGVRVADGALVAFREVEVEARTADPGALDELEDRLVRLGADRSGFPSKLARLLSAEAPLGAGDPVLDRLAAQVGELLRHEAGARSGDAEAIHDLRVAIRRLRSCLRSYKGAFAGGATEPLLAALAEAGSVVGAARDAGVLAARLEADLEEVPSVNVLGPVRAVLRARTARELSHSLRDLQAYLDGPGYRALLEQLVTFVTAPRLAPVRRRRAYYRACLARERRRVARRVAAAASRTGPQHDTALHEARKALKRARYAAEVAAPVLGKKARRMARGATKLQDLLGEHHDAVVARDRLREEGARAGVRPGENGFTFGELHAREDVRAAAAARRFAKRWRGVASSWG